MDATNASLLEKKEGQENEVEAFVVDTRTLHAFKVGSQLTNQQAGGSRSRGWNFLRAGVDVDSAGSTRGGFLKIISVGIPTYAGMKTGF